MEDREHYSDIIKIFKSRELYAERVSKIAEETGLNESQVYDLIDILGDMDYKDPLNVAEILAGLEEGEVRRSVRVYCVERREYFNNRIVYSDVVACFDSYMAAYDFTESDEGQALLKISQPGYSRKFFIYHNGYTLNNKEVEE